MNNGGLFIIGTFVSLLVTASLALLSWGAVLDGRYAREQLSGADDRGIDEAPHVVDAAWPPAVHTPPTSSTGETVRSQS